MEIQFYGNKKTNKLYWECEGVVYEGSLTVDHLDYFTKSPHANILKYDCLELVQAVRHFCSNMLQCPNKPETKHCIGNSLHEERDEVAEKKTKSIFHTTPLLTRTFQ